MAIKFRNALLGFNKDDVHSFVMTAKEKEYKSEKKIKELTENNEKLNDKMNKLSSEHDLVKAQLDEYKKKEDSLNKLSESIGRLYLVAQSNAKAIAEASKENIEQSNMTVEMNLNIADTAHNEFSDIERELNEKVANFNQEINELRERIFKTKELVLENNAKIADCEKNLDEMTEEISVR